MTYNAPSKRPSSRNTLSTDEESIDAFRQIIVNCPNLEYKPNHDCGQTADSGKDIRESKYPGTSTRSSYLPELEREDVRIDSRSFVQNVYNSNSYTMLESLTPAAVAISAENMKSVMSSQETSHEASEEGTAIANRPSHRETKNQQKSSTKPGRSTQLPDRNHGGNLVQKLAKEVNHEEITPQPSSRPQPVKTAIPTVRHHRRRSDLPLSPPPHRKPRGSPGLPELLRRDSTDHDLSGKLQRMSSFPDDNSLARKLSHEKKNKMNRSPSIKSVGTFPEVVLPSVGELPFTPKTVAMTSSGDFVDAQSDSIAGGEVTPPTPPRLQQKTQDKDEPKEPEKIQPQVLGILSVQNIDFCCNILLAQNASAISSTMAKDLVVDQGRESYNPLLQWKQHDTAEAWKIFIEHSFFYVLSQSHLLLKSFRQKDTPELIDSRTLQYCLFRIAKAVPHIFLDALWIAAADLFEVADEVKDQMGHKDKDGHRAGKKQKSMSTLDIMQLLTILCHALIATVPCSGNPDVTHEACIERGTGGTYARVYRKSPSLDYSLALSDTLTNDLAQRLADRVFTAVPALEYFEKVTRCGTFDLEMLIESLMEDSCSPTYFGQYPELKTNFCVNYKEPLGRRSAIVLIDFAKEAMLRNWNAEPVVKRASIFGGALSLLAAMHEAKEALNLDKDLFETTFLGDHLALTDISFDWAMTRRSKKLLHVLDAPFLFDDEKLTNYFRAINYSRMSGAYDSATTMRVRMNAIAQPQTLLHNSERNHYLNEKLGITLRRYLTIHVRRNNILKDSFDQLWHREERELLKPFKIVMGEKEGEQGQDQGGVTQEYFRVVMGQAMNPHWGGFTIDPRTKMIWFLPSSPLQLWQFELIGLIFGLALYNGCSLSVTMPLAFYRKLLGLPVDRIEHIEDGWPDLAAGLQKLLDWDEKDGSVEDVFCRTYEFSVDVVGRTVTRDMNETCLLNEPWPQFSQLPATSHTSKADAEASEAPMVTNANKEFYATDYIKHLTDVSIAPQFEAFKQGFMRPLHPQSLKLFSPQLMREVIEGVQTIDVDELEKITRYEGFKRSDRTIQMFWSVVREYSQAELKKLLEFVTASDRVPVGGMSGVQFSINKNGEDLTELSELPAYEEGGHDQGWREKGGKGKLPLAYTCFGILLLAEYRDREVLKRKLASALENARGFGFG